jgi:hypothetical protein
VSGWTEDHFGARRDPSPGMRGAIFNPEICLGFDNPRRGISVD